MDDRTKQLAEHLEKVRVTLLALETYMAQVRDLIAAAQQLIGDDQGAAPRPRKLPARTKRLG